jgi:RHS repeat-associated protein
MEVVGVGDVEVGVEDEGLLPVVVGLVEVADGVVGVGEAVVGVGLFVAVPDLGGQGERGGVLGAGLEYDPATGDPVKTTARNADGSVASTVTTGYDAWGRTISYAPSGEAPTTTVYAAGRVATVADANGSTRYTYDGTDAAGKAERRGLATKVEVTTAGATWSSTGAYDADSALVTQKLPGGVTRQVDLDQAGEPVGLRYTGQLTTVNPDGTTSVVPDGGWLAWSQDNDIAGRVVREWTPDGAAFTGPAAEDDPNDPGDAIPYDRGYSYDAAGRLTQVRDRTAAATGIDVLDQAPACVTRSYSFDANHNRLARTTTPAAADGSCATTGGSTVSRTFDTADRPMSYVYDALGRILTLPAADAPHPAAGDVTLAYYDNDLARSIVQGGTTTTFTLDASNRRATETVSNGSDSSVTFRHYTDDSDNPTWITQGGTTRRYTELVGDALALTVDSAGRGSLTIASPHGDVVSTVDIVAAGSTATSLSGWNQFDEYGNPDPSNTADTGELNYGWLGENQRAVSGAGLILMGVRLYNPVTGLFTSVDPVSGGNANEYTYPADPINQFDLDGQRVNPERSGGVRRNPILFCRFVCPVLCRRLCGPAARWIKKKYFKGRHRGKRLPGWVRWVKKKLNGASKRCTRSWKARAACFLLSNGVESWVEGRLTKFRNWA